MPVGTRTTCRRKTTLCGDDSTELRRRFAFSFKRKQSDMRLVVAAIVAFCLLSWMVPTASFADASCTTQLESPLTSETRAYNAYEAHDDGTAYAEYQTSIEFRANCVDETSGLAYLWNEFYEANDYAFFAQTAAESELWQDEASGDWDKARELLHDVRSHTIRGDLLDLSNALNKLLVQDAPQHEDDSTPDDTPPSSAI